MRLWVTLRHWASRQSAALSSAFRTWYADRAEECRRCHACEGEVAALEKVCPHCGSGEPARLSIAPAAVAIFSAGIVLLLMAIFI